MPGTCAHTLEIFPPLRHPIFNMASRKFCRPSTRVTVTIFPVVISPGINQPYIYVLFFEKYPPAAYQRGPVLQEPGIFGHVAGFDRYRFVPQNRPYVELPHGVFVFRSAERAFAMPDATIYYPDGSIAYKIIVK